VKYLLDTCVLSELTKPLPEDGVVRWLRQADEANLFVSVLTLGELEKGVRRLPASKRKASLEEWLSETRENYAARILEVTVDVALEWGRTGAKTETKAKPIPVIDGLIGATALVHRLTVVTRNTADMERTGVQVLNLWD
jgi:predicted nucleic acid-binding protein